MANKKDHPDGKSPTDEAGPMIGWSLGSGLDRRPLDGLLEFPSDYTFKVLGLADAAFSAQLVKTIISVLGREDTPALTTRKSAKGKYASVTLHVHVFSADEVYAIYAALAALPDVRMVL